MSEEVEGQLPYALTLNGEGLSLDRKVSVTTARSIMNLLLGGAASSVHQVGARENTISAPRAPIAEYDERPMSLREYLDAVEPKRNPDKIVSIAEFLSSREGQHDFTSEDLKGRFRTAGEAPPGNFSRDFAWTIQNGWIAEDAQKPSFYYVTQRGKQAIEQKFSKEIKKKSSINRGAIRRKGRKSGSSDMADE
jgi:hypothetical protein